MARNGYPAQFHRRALGLVAAGKTAELPDSDRADLRAKELT